MDIDLEVMALGPLSVVEGGSVMVTARMTQPAGAPVRMSIAAQVPSAFAPFGTYDLTEQAQQIQITTVPDQAYTGGRQILLGFTTDLNAPCGGNKVKNLTVNLMESGKRAFLLSARGGSFQASAASSGGSMMGVDYMCNYANPGSSQLMGGSYAALYVSTQRTPPPLETDWPLAANATYFVPINGLVRAFSTDQSKRPVFPFHGPLGTNGGRVWLGTDTNWAVGDNCGGWTMTAGNGVTADASSTPTTLEGWLAQRPCMEFHHILCVER